MFKKIFIDLCNQRKESPSAVCAKVGLSNATFSCWTEESVPRRATLQRIADYFGVSVDYLLGKEEKENAPTEDNLSEGEKMLLELFRQIPEEKQQMALQMLRAALDK